MKAATGAARQMKDTQSHGACDVRTLLGTAPKRGRRRLHCGRAWHKLFAIGGQRVAGLLAGKQRHIQRVFQTVNAARYGRKS